MKLPIADARTTWDYTRRLLRANRREFLLIAAMTMASALAGLVGPWLLGRLVDDVSTGTTAGHVRDLVLIAVAAILVRGVIQKVAQQRAMVFGETVFAAMREEFLDTATALPLSTVERAGTGDLVARTTNDIAKLQNAVRFGVPQLTVSVVTILLTVVACLVMAPLVAVAIFVGLPLLLAVVRWYLRRAPDAYQAESATYAALNGTITESVEGASTVDALDLGSRRNGRSDADIEAAYRAELRTLRLRTVLFPGVDLTFVIAPVAVLVWGGYLASQGTVTMGAVTALVMYTFQLTGPVWNLVYWLDEMSVAAVSLARVIGVRLVPADRVASDASPSSGDLEARGVRYAYREGHDVLHGIDLDLRPGERLAIVGPSGAGKSTLGRMLAGIHPPTGGSVTVGGVPLVDLPLEELRRRVALVTQEHHVFVGTIADNLRLADVGASDARLREALAAVDALSWVDELAEGLATEIGSGGAALTPAQAQQVALARLVLLDPDVLVLDEATSLLDPRAARHLERSLAAVLHGRTVVAIAHRLHTAHDADRVAVVEDGRITELGSHDELVAAGGSYAALWHSWQHE
ncbi:ABC transporter related protein [Xylanimonas cellulosilytica DSM 15894]|uniref:ABC transporter related protein n=1 Tax=Xylanimonas cellulosilytica (strain DSM 15894 / JCM 12276 / CECT 5975 / KCTC 9989 / LMG 20990 / NBRC 107835 / XIL07) TaxID=446471 RepID=D1BXC6_XYLCX|nr:ABC transporter ATP-binding protein [Xylanimonas cellulosilytica]ACZ29736.1 ABC transporter related protein [Xylanimonas cellulosilytica DSM 15894]